VPGLVRRFRLSLIIYAAPLLLVPALGPRRLLGYYSGVADLGIHPLAIGHWFGTDALLLAYTAGFALVPGAVAGLAFALAHPRVREHTGYAALTGGILLALLAETGLYATNGSARFQERYLMILVPLVFPAFWIWVQRGRPWAKAVAVLALGLIALAARVPLSGYTISDAKQDSPFLLAAFRLERAIGIGDGSLLIAVIATLLAGLAVATCFRPAFARWAVLATIAASGFVSLGAVAFDTHVVRSVRTTLLPPDARWVDHSGLGPVTLLQTPATPHAAAHEQLFWNRSLGHVYFLDDATALDAFGSPRAHAASDGRILAGAGTLRGPLLISNYAVRVRLANAVRVARGANYELWRPLGTPRFALFVGGLYHDGWLAQSGHITVWPAANGRVQGTLTLPLSLPPKPRSERTVLQLHGPGIQRRVTVLPGRSVVLKLPVDRRGPWTLNFHTDRPGYLADARAISVMAGMPTFTGLFCGTAPPTNTV